MKNKTIEIFLIILLIDILLIAISFISEKAVSNNLTIKLPDFNSLSDFKYNYNNESADSIIDSYLSGDSHNKKCFHRYPLLVGPKVINKNFYNNAKDNVYALDDFFKSLIEEKDTTVVRIAHYGDSQLEGDRISCYVRNLLQQKFGGSGVGFVPFDDIASNVNLQRSSSPNWLHYTIFHNRYGYGYYGLSGNVYKFSKNAIPKNNFDTLKNNDTSLIKINTQTVYSNAFVDITLYPNITYQKIQLMYGHSTANCGLNIYNMANHSKILTDSLAPSDGFTVHPLKILPSIKSFRMEFTGNQSPDFYGLLIDGKRGVQLDNYAIRGHSGDGLLIINPEYLAVQLRKLNVKLIIFQYGNNAVPCVNSDEKCEEIEQLYYDIFKRFKNIAPEISILVIGAGDMACMYNGAYQSYCYLPKFRDAQKKAALDAGCAFWDIFEVMGGANSIINWTNKGLASHDGHFTPKGQEIIGKQLYETMMIEFNQYKFRQRKNNS